MQRSATVDCNTADPIVATLFYRVQSLPGNLRRFHHDPDSDCLLWDGPPASGGHGQVCAPEGTKTAHVAVWEALFGPLGPGLTLHHTCANKLCVNPFHQQPRQTNEHRALHAREKWAEQRNDPSLRLIGPRPVKRRLTDEQRQEIRDLYMAREATQPQLARRYGVSRPTIAKIVHEALHQAKPGEASRVIHTPGIPGTTGHEHPAAPVAAPDEPALVATSAGERAES